ncbi:Type I restriction modification DNA specificity domain-containing protein [Ruminococcus sp. YRD2003]|uniref:restriction endonuclease subunit S n=1 Tax=Ruminococcus sp. YRD2003 TaxID=1452313 RepID=UPI0008ACE425|nr:Type I restriction modification DNA specificity domain-containing protein [Ruminococcus flavefaciens]
MEITYKALSSLVNRKIGYGIVQPGDSVPNGVPVIKVFNILAGLKSIDSLDTTKAENAAKYSRTKLNGGELIVSVVGTVGRTAIVPMSFAGCNLVRATALVDIPDETIALWVKYYIDSPGGQLYIDTNLNTTVQPTLNIKSLESMPIPFFEGDYMEKAVSILSRIDEKIKLNIAINENLRLQAA